MFSACFWRGGKDYAWFLYVSGEVVHITHVFCMLLARWPKLRMCSACFWRGCPDYECFLHVFGEVAQIMRQCISGESEGDGPL